MDLVYFIASDVVVQYSIKCAGCGNSEKQLPGEDLYAFRYDLHADGWTTRGPSGMEQPFCGDCSKGKE